MKTNFIVTTVLLASFTNSVMANQVTLLNHSPAKYHPMTVVYKIAYKNPKQPVVFGSPQMIQLDKETTLQFDMKNYQNKLYEIVQLGTNLTTKQKLLNNTKTQYNEILDKITNLK